MLVAVLLMTIWAVAAVVSALEAHENLEVARESLARAQDGVAAQELELVGDELATTAEHARRAATSLHRPHMVPLRLLPVLGPNAQAATALADGVAVTAESGEALASALDAAATATPAPTAGNELSLGHVHQLASPLRDLSDALIWASAEVEEADSRWLIGPLERARRTFLGATTPLVGGVAVAADVTEVLPVLLGEDEPRRYLVGAASLSELRGSGGLIGSWTVLSADESTLEFDEFADIDDLATLQVDAAAPSDEYAQRYGRLGGLREWRNVNLSPDFPSTAEVMLEMWEEQGGAPLDGVILVDAVALATLTEGPDRLEIPGVATVQPEDVLRFVALDAYAAFDDDAERKRALGTVATTAFTSGFARLAEGDLSQRVSLVSDLVEGGHVRVHSRDAAVQRVLASTGADGALAPTDGEMMGVFVNNIAANKVDWFTRRRVEHHVRLLPDGRTEATVTVELHNRAPGTGYPRHVLGPWRPELAAGDNLSYINLLCGRGCQHLPVADSVTDGGEEAGHPVVDVRMLLPAGARRTLTHRTETAGGWWVEDEEIVVPVVHLLQPTLHPTQLGVTLTPPPGWVPADGPPGAELADGDLRYETSGSGRMELSFRLARVPDSSVATAGRPRHPPHSMYGTGGAEPEPSAPAFNTTQDDQRNE